MKENVPYLSVVIAVRNDNYGGDFDQRLHTALLWNTRLLEKYQVSAEFVLVNWNPISENEPLLSNFKYPGNRNFVQYRLIEVPAELHNLYNENDVRRILPMYEFIAKNVGIQRSLGSFVLCTNADILLSEIIVQSLARKDLETQVLYRCVRVDFEGQLEYLSNEKDIQKKATNFFLRTGVLSSSFKFPFNIKNKWCVFKDFLLQVILTITISLTVRSDYPEERIFIFKYPFNASGDFALMDKNTFMSLGLYPEDTLISTHADSLHLLKCLKNNLKIIEIEGVVYHQEHARRFNFNEVNKDMEQMFYRLLSSIRSYLKKEPLDFTTQNKLENFQLEQKVI